MQIALELTTKGEEVTFIHCDKNFEKFCISMSAFGLTFESTNEEKLNICDLCIRSRNYISRIPTLKNITLPKFENLPPQVLHKLNLVNVDNWMEFMYEDLPIGKIAAYEFLLNHKINSDTIPLIFFPEYLEALKYTLHVQIFANTFLKENHFDAVYVYNRIYSLNNIFCKIAENYSIPTYTLHAAGPAGKIYSSFSFYRNDHHALTLNRSSTWISNNFSINSYKKARKVLLHFKGLLLAKSHTVYSSKFKSTSRKKLERKIGIGEHAKVILLTTSSADEIRAIKLIGIDPKNDQGFRLFESQIDWVRSVCEFVKNNPSLFLIIRISHP